MNKEVLRNRLEVAITGRKETLDIGGLELVELPVELRELTWLKRLNISGNGISHLPFWINELGLLEVFDARNNNLSELNEAFSALQNLRSVYFRNNKFEKIPEELFRLKKLKYASFSNNQISRIPPELFEIENINIDHNPVIDPPIEVYSRGFEALRNYFNERATGTDTLHEAKLLIVGEPGAGKTSLMNKILDENYVLILQESSTKGIKIKPYFFSSKEGIKFRLNIWDFGGQEIYHTTHQFFLTKRSLYILLSDNRAEDTDFNYWLQSIELLSGNSPLIIVQNEKHDRKHNINEAGMRERFKNIKRFFSFNLGKDKITLKSLAGEIQHQAANLSHIGTELPKIWVSIRNALEVQAARKAYISEAEYLQICSDFGMEEKERAWFLSDFFHDLGVFLHFRDHAILKRWIILKPDWGTEAVYKVLDNPLVIKHNGYFTRNDLNSIWQESRYADMHDELISLMMKFELCYKLDDEKTFIAAQLLQREKPFYEWTDNDNIVFKYDYYFMPKGIITRFIVRMHDYIYNEKSVWREGVLLHRANTFAEIIETYGKREIKIKVRGENKKEFLAIIIDSLDKINLTYSNLKLRKLIPCNCKACKNSFSPFYFEYNTLRKFLSNRIEEARCEESMQLIKILPLIDDVFGEEKRKIETKIFISYNIEDESCHIQFRKHLKALQKSGKISIDDKSDVPVGENEKLFIRDKLDTCSVIISLISADYILNEVNYNEMTKALDRSETDSCLFIPVIIKDCDYITLPISSVKPVLYKNKPLLNSSDNIDLVISNAVSQIKESIGEFVSKSTF